MPDQHDTVFTDAEEYVEDLGYEHDSMDEICMLFVLKKLVNEAIKEAGVENEEEDYRLELNDITCVGSTYAYNDKEEGLVLAIKDSKRNVIKMLMCVERELGTIQL